MGRNFKNYKVWKLGYRLALEVYKVTEDFPEFEKGCLFEQLRRAAISIPSNIAEGSSRPSERSFLQFLSYSYGSASEAHVQLKLAKDVEYLSPRKYKKLKEMIEKFKKMLYKFARKVEESTDNNFYKTKFSQDLNEKAKKSKTRKSDHYWKEKNKRKNE